VPPVEVKAEFVARLVDAGHTVVETTSLRTVTALAGG
jgi:hypothetical protein